MDNQERSKLQEEINYWTNLISSHKSSKNPVQYNQRNINSPPKQFAWKSRKFDQQSNFQKYKTQNTKRCVPTTNFYSTTSVDNVKNYCTFSTTKANHTIIAAAYAPKKVIHKWRNIGNPKKQSFNSNSSKTLHNLPLNSSNAMNSMVKTNALLLNTVKHKIPPPTKDSSHFSSVSSEKSSRFSWHKNKISVKANVKTTGDKKQNKIKNTVNVSMSKYRYRRRKSFEKASLSGSIGATMKLRKLILAKYLRPHAPRPVNLSKNPYKVVKRPVSVAVMSGNASQLSAVNQTKFTPTRLFASKQAYRGRRRRYKVERYDRFGKCNRGEECRYTHDPRRVAVCTRFLRGTCHNKACPFSHKTSKARMPLCSFFLRGKCSTKNCSYLHVFHGERAVVCRNFAETGFCSEAAECNGLHLRVCPDFYQSSKCNGRCNLPHRNRHLRKRKVSPLLQSLSVGKTVEAEKPQTLCPPALKSDAKILSTVEVASTSELLSRKRIQPRLKNKTPQDIII